MESVASVAAPVEFQLPVPPSSNRWWRMITIGGKHKPRRTQMVLSAEAKIYKEETAKRLLVELRGRGYRALPLFPTGPVGITIAWHRTKRLGDLDKRVPIILDALQGTVYANDNQLVDIHASLHESAVGDYLHVGVWAAGARQE